MGSNVIGEHASIGDDNDGYDYDDVHNKEHDDDDQNIYQSIYVP